MKMPSFVPLDKNKHRNLKVRLDTSFSSCKTAHLTAITLKEVPLAAAGLPLVIIQAPQGGGYHIASIMGVEPNTNLYCQDDKWQGQHVPWNVQRFPFDMRGDKEKVIIFIDENSDLVSESEGEALFDAEGNAAPHLERVRGLVTQIAESEISAETFFKQIVEYDLLEPVSLRVTFTTGEQKNLVGMYGIGEERLMKLSDEAILDLMRTGSLGMLYAMLTSIGQINALVRLSQSTAKPIANINYGKDEGAGSDGGAAAPAEAEEPAAEKPAAKAKKPAKKAAKKSD